MKTMTVRFTIICVLLAASIASASQLDADATKCLEGKESYCEKVWKKCSARNALACEYLTQAAMDRGDTVAATSGLKLACAYGSKRSCDVLDATARREANIRNLETKKAALEIEIAQGEIESRRLRNEEDRIKTGRSNSNSGATFNSFTKTIGATTSEQSSAKQTNCETQPVRDIYSGRINSLRTVCRDQ